MTKSPYSKLAKVFEDLWTRVVWVLDKDCLMAHELPLGNSELQIVIAASLDFLVFPVRRGVSRFSDQ